MVFICPGLLYHPRPRDLQLDAAGRGQLKCDGTRAETRFRLSAKRTSPFRSAGASIQSTTGSRGVRISGSNAGYTMFRGSVKGTCYPLHSPVSPPVRHRVPSHFTWSLLRNVCVLLTDYTALYPRRQYSKWSPS